MTDTLLDTAAIRSRCDAATIGPWRPDGYYVHSVALRESGKPVLTIYDEGGHTKADAAFIAHARTDIPALLDALAARDAEIAALAAQLRKAEITLGEIYKDVGRMTS